MASPSLSGLDAPTFAENTVNGSPQLLDADVTFTDSDNDFSGGSLVITGLLAEDRISFVGDSRFWVSGGILNYDNNGSMPGGMFSIGTVTGGVGDTFTIAFNLPASTIITASILEQIIEHLAYANVSNTPTAMRTLSINVVDAAGNDMRDAPSYTEQAGAASPLDGVNAGVSTRAAFADFDGDGDLDMLAANFQGDASYFENTGTATAPVFSAATSPLTLPNGLYFTTVAVGDIDGDGDIDVIAGDVDGTIRYFENTGTASSAVFDQQTGGDNPFGSIALGSDSYASPALGDVDGDGDLDLVVGQRNGSLAFYRNTGTAALPTYEQQTGASNPFNSYSSSGFLTYSSPTLADFDGDGDLDLVVGTNNSFFNWMENIGTATAPTYQSRFSQAPFTPSVNGGSMSAPTFADLDGDGDLDLVSGQSNFGFHYFQNTTVVTPTQITITVSAEAEPTGPTAGADVLTGTAAADDLDGLGGDDTLDGADGDDVIDGGAGTDTLTGGAGADYLKGGDGDDILTGGTGDDTYVVDSLGDSVSEAGGDGVDEVIARVSWTLGAGFENLTLGSAGGATDGTGNALANVITGNASANTLSGQDGEDVLTGGGGNDVLLGGADNDILDGGNGADRLDGGAGIDAMTGGLGNDVYVVDDADDAVMEALGEGTDSIEASVNVHLGNYVSVENATLTGSAVLAQGSAEANVLTGNGLANGLYGYGGNDTLYGLGGDDELWGGVGTDVLAGGAGADLFGFGAAQVSNDRILDLNFAEGDRVDLSGIDANTTIGADGDQAFAFVAKFTKQAGQAVLTYNAAQDITWLKFDVDGDGLFDGQISITGNHLSTSTNLYTGGGDTDGGWIL